MPKCSKCKYSEKIYDQDFEEYWYICQVDGEYIAEEIAEDKTKLCDLYVSNSNDDTTKRT